MLRCAGARGLFDGHVGATHTDCLKGSSLYFTAAARGGPESGSSLLAAEGPRPFWLFQRAHQKRASEEHKISKASPLITGELGARTFRVGCSGARKIAVWLFESQEVWK